MSDASNQTFRNGGSFLLFLLFLLLLGFLSFDLKLFFLSILFCLSFFLFFFLSRLNWTVRLTRFMMNRPIPGDYDPTTECFVGLALHRLHVFPPDKNII